jgi:hypothetical protein
MRLLLAMMAETEAVYWTSFQPELVQEGFKLACA